jgi:hypothetical protein
MRVVSLFDFSTYALKPWFEAGHETIAIDELFGQFFKKELRPSKCWATKTLNWDLCKAETFHRVSDLKPDFLIAFPPCTDLAVSGAKHFAKKAALDPDFQKKAVDMCRLAEQLGNQCGVPWMAENPLSCLSTQWRKPDWLFHPYQYSGFIPGSEKQHPDWPEYVPDYDWYPKRTGIWCGNGFSMPEACERRRVFDGERLSFEEWQLQDGGSFWKERRYSPQFKKLGGSSLKTKIIRSLTPRGFAAAVHAVNDPS